MRVSVIGLGAMLLATVLPAAADAQYWGGGGYRGPAYAQEYGRGYGPPRGYRGAPPPGYGYGDGYGNRRGYRGRGRYRCDRGTGGTIIGAIAGGLLGNSVAGRGDRGVGTIVGAGVGALAGRAIDRDC